MTENEATEKWCPMMQCAGLGIKAIITNRGEGTTGPSDGNPNVNCIGSACMAWRWNFSPEEREAALEHNLRQKKANGPQVAIPEANGGCGLIHK